MQMPQETIEDAARVLVAHSRLAAAWLDRRSPSSPFYQRIYNAVASRTLANPKLALTSAERDLVARFITRSGDGAPR